jgi:two-component system phosphate regulon sensor histidine kinase PhoR
LRIPLHVKLMVSYLLVVGLLFVPTLLYLRTSLRSEIEEELRAELDKQATLLAVRLAGLGPTERVEAARTLAALMPERLTVVDPQGAVIADSAREGLANHLDRPEILAALAEGSGTAIRRSASTNDTRLYVAKRFPAAGEVTGVVRLSVPVRALVRASTHGTWFVNRAGALAVSVAILLSLLGFLLVSRPLRRLTATIRAFAGGDFGHPVLVDTKDELGETAQALIELAGHIRGRLLASGADRAALHSLLDDLPAGVVLFDPERNPLLVAAQARVTLELAADDEAERVRSLPELPGQGPVVARVLETGLTEEAPLEPPWLPGRKLRARWVALYAPDGRRQAALVVIEASSVEAELARVRRSLSGLAEQVREAAIRVSETETAARLVELAEQADREAPLPAARPAAVRAIGVGELCRAAAAEVAPLAARGGVRVEFDLAESDVLVVEADGRTRRALRQLLQGGLAEARGGALRVRAQVHEARVRLSARITPEDAAGERMAALVQCLGGDAGTERDGEAAEAWLLLPRA